ncbi:MAG: RNA polymerase factor sigma-54 [Acidobacteriota bacterium]|nr:RNA polymerase factor sigma-54 [Acidobacteriota bacterium]
MVLLQPKLNLKVSQKQILTPGLVQMVSVLALNKLELKDMINAEMVENPVLEELDSTVPLIDEIAGKEEKRDREQASDEAPPADADKKDPFDEIDFGSFFQDYLDPGYRSPVSEIVDKPSFENFLSRPATLTDHLSWQLSALSLRPEVREAAELIIGNLEDDGYLTASEEELMRVANGQVVGLNGREAVEPVETETERGISVAADEAVASTEDVVGESRPSDDGAGQLMTARTQDEASSDTRAASTHAKILEMPANYRARFEQRDLAAALELVRQMDPVGVAARDLRDCLLLQLKHQQKLAEDEGDDVLPVIEDCIAIVGDHLKLLQNKQHREIAKAIGKPVETIQAALDHIRTLDPKPGLRYNKVEPRLIEPDVAFVKHGDDYLIMMNEDDMPVLRLNPTYRKLLHRDAAEKDVRNYVKERYKSAIQLIKNIEQRKQTITKVCYVIVSRQREFLDQGVDQLKPMMIKEVAEEIGVHPSTVSRAVANKYAHTPQGVFELRYFFSESVQGPEGGNTSLLILKRRVKKLIEEEDPSRPLTDEQITRILQSQGIQVTRRTVAKYREDMKIPSTHQRRVKN